MQVQQDRNIWGWFDSARLKTGESHRSLLYISDYVGFPEVGEYSVTLLYHRAHAIADFESAKRLDELILLRSEPFKLRIVPREKRVIRLDPASREKVAKLAAGLPMQGVIKVIDGRYGLASRDFVEPGSAAGQLLTMDWQAVPTLIKLLDDGELTSHQVGWILSILYTITREQSLSPTDADGFRWMLPHHQVLTIQPLGPTITSYSNGRIADKAQDRLIQQWREFVVKNLEIHESPKPAPAAGKK